MKERKLGVLGQKIGMTRIFDDKGLSQGVTVLQVGPCTILTKRSVEKNKNNRYDQHNALQLSFDPKPDRKVNKPLKGHAKSGSGNSKIGHYISEFRVNKEILNNFEVGTDITLENLNFKSGDLIDVKGKTKGKGFQGVVRKYNFRGYHASHAHEVLRHGGSIGCRKYPGRVFKGRKMPGQMGNKNVTIQNLKILDVREKEGILLIQGSVPGANNSYVEIRPAIKKHP